MSIRRSTFVMVILIKETSYVCQCTRIICYFSSLNALCKIMERNRAVMIGFLDGIRINVKLTSDKSIIINTTAKLFLVIALGTFFKIFRLSLR